MTRCALRRSRRALIAFAIAFVHGPCDTAAFTTLPATAATRPQRLPQPLYMAATKSSTTYKRPLLKPEEEHELLLQAREQRRLKDLENELALKSPDLSRPMLSVLSKAAGYGTDWEAYEDALDAGHKAREMLVTTHMGLVHYSVGEILKNRKRKTNSLLSREDLVQEGAIGLARAVDKFNPGMNTKFSTYAVYWIRAAILRCIAERDDIMRVPEHMSAAVRKVSAAAQRLGLELDGDQLLNLGNGEGALWKEAQAAKALAEEAGLTDKQVEQALKVKQRQGGYVSYETWMQNGKNMQVDLATTEEPSSTTPDSEHLKSILSSFLRPKEMEALSWRYGLTSTPTYRDYLGEAEEEIFGESSLPVKGRWGEAMSFTEVGKQMSISAEYGRRLCHKALEKLKRAAEEGQLEPALLY